MKKAFIFDMDGLLINSEPLWQQAGVDVLNAQGVPVTLRDMGDWTGAPTKVIVHSACLRYQANIDEARTADLLLETAVQRIIAAKPLMPGVKEILALLKSHNIKMAIASASPPELLESIVESCGIADYFSYISSAHGLPYSKPHPLVYLNALEKLGVTPQEAVGLEDSRVGMIAIKAASMDAIVIPSEEARNAPYWTLADYRLNSLLEIDEAFLAKMGIR